MKYKVHYHSLINIKAFARVPLKDRLRIKHAIEEKLATKPEVFSKPLQHSLSGHRSLRVGEYRIIFRVQKKDIFILLIGHRKDVYKQ